MKKTFTIPSECIFPTQDNKNGDLVVSKGDYIVKQDDIKYMVIELLGVGTFGQVFRCISNEGDEVAIKVVKSINKYFQYEMNEVRILRRIKDKNLTNYFAEIYDAFIYKQHLCIVIELLGKNLYDLLKISRFNGFSLHFQCLVLKQILEGIHELHNQGIIHCDLKPENILFEDYFTNKVKIIDFGSSSTKTLSSIFYIQSRFYRAPEVILGIPYSCAIDVWSFGCIAYELIVGEPLFPGTSNMDQILKIHGFYPNGIPLFMLEHGEFTHMYFEKENNYKPISSIIHPTVGGMKEKIYSKFGVNHQADLLIDLVLRAINPSYLERDLPHTILKHPFFNIDTEENVNLDIIRVNAPEFPPDSLKARKMSMYDIRNFDGEALFNNKRKGSLFDPNQENRFN